MWEVKNRWLHQKGDQKLVWSQSVNTCKGRKSLEERGQETRTSSWNLKPITNQLQNTFFFMGKVISHQGKPTKEGLILWWFSEECKAMPPFLTVNVITSTWLPVQKLVYSTLYYTESKTHLCLLSRKQWRNNILTS